MSELQEYISLDDLSGKWYIHLTNFPMWLKGNRTQPTFNYKKAERNAQIGLTDEVQFFKNEKIKTIKGFDKPTNEWNSAFVWRGEGWMRILTSYWKILHLEEDWAIIYFEKTLFTPAGFDVISREEQLDEATFMRIQQRLNILNVKELTKI